MVTKKTQIIFFTLIFPWLKCSYLLSVADGFFKVVLQEGEDHKEHFDQIACFSAKLEPKTGKLNAQICPKKHKNGRHLEFWPPFWNSNDIFGDFFKLENVASSHNLILQCKIPSNSIKQGTFILRAKFKPYFYTRACKWIGFSQILQHISLSLIEMARNPT